MKKYIITYTFRDTTRNYMDFYNAIKNNVEELADGDTLCPKL